MALPIFVGAIAIHNNRKWLGREHAGSVDSPAVALHSTSQSPGCVEVEAGNQALTKSRNFWKPRAVDDVISWNAIV